jgi:hypothetical protein
MSSAVSPTTMAALAPWMERGDPLADAVVAPLRPGRPQSLLRQVRAKASAGDPACRRFLEDAARPLPWVDGARFERGRRLVVGLGTQLGLVLTVGSLVQGYASPSLAAPLAHTGRLVDDARRRLYETGQMVHNARAPGGMRPGAVGWCTVVQVRLLHAWIRGHLLARGWRGPDGGAPLHQLDMLHTSTGFSFKSMENLGRVGTVLSPHERADLHHFWRVLHVRVGVDESLLPTCPETEAELSRALDAARFVPDNPHARPLALATLQALAGEPPFFLPVEALAAVSRRCMGDALADAMGLPQAGPWAQAVRAVGTLGPGLMAVHRHVPVIRAMRSRVNVALYGHTLVARLGPRPEQRAFGAVAGEAGPWPFGLEPPLSGRSAA